MSRSTQRIVVIILALLLVVPAGAIGIRQLTGAGEDHGSDGYEVRDVDDAPGMPAAPGDPGDPGAPGQQSERTPIDPSEQLPRPQWERPAEPALMTEQTPAGAEATLTYMLDAYPYMMTTGDTSVWEGSVDSTCQVCTTFLENARTLNAQGGYLVDGKFEVTETRFDGVEEAPTSGEVVVTFTQEPSVLVDDPAYEGWRLEEVSGDLSARMLWDGQSWRVLDMMIAPDAVPQGEAPQGETP